MRKGRNIYCLDGDGSLIMNMGSLAINASMDCTNFKHIVFKTSAHDSVRCQPILGDKIDMRSIALNSVYKWLKVVRKEFEIRKSINEVSEIDGPVLIEIRVEKRIPFRFR